MDSRTGKKIRLGQLFNPDSGRTVLVAYSHASFMGPLPGMRTRAELEQTARALRAADGIMLSPGLVPLLEEIFTGRGAPALVVQVDWQSFSRKVIAYTEGAAVAMAAVEQAAAAGCSAVMSYLYLGFADPDREKAEIARNAALVRDCERFGIPLMIEPRSAREKSIPADKSDPEVMSLYARVSAELGADLVKVIDPGDDAALAQVVESCPVPVLLAGGAQRDDFAGALRRARAAVAAGCAGLVYGRNVFQHRDPAAALRELRGIVHETRA